MRKVKKELYVALGIFLFLAIGMHFSEWMSHPIDHIVALPNAGAYGIGAIHPIVFTIIAYLLIYPFRVVFSKFRKKDTTT